MSLKAELETWSAALKAYDEEDFEKSLDLFSRIAESSKILTNMGLIYATLGEHEAAVEKFIEATGLDSFLAVAYFQCGVSNFLLARYDLALKDFEEALLYLRGNQAINYEQLGLKFKLFSAEVLFNKGLSQIYLGRVDEGLLDMQEARKDKATDEHNVIDDAIADRGEGYTVFSIPVGVLYRPSEKKLKNAVSKNYMGTPVLIAASDSRDAFTGFTGSTNLKRGISPAGVFVDTAAPELSRSATEPAPSLPKLDTEVGRAPALGRANTTLNVPSNARERIAGSDPSPGATISRSNTTISPMKPSANATMGMGMGGPVRGLSVKKAERGPGGSAAPPPPLKDNENRLTDFYDDYLDSYGNEGPPPPLPLASAGAAPTGPPDRIAAWARSNANPNNPPPVAIARSGSRSAPASNYAPSSFGGGSVRRRVTRRNTARTVTSRAQSAYEEEEEGYASGDYDDGPFELVKIRVKLHYKDDVRGMALTPETTFEDFMDKVTSKFGKGFGGLGLKFKDEDGGKVTLQDESDYDLAIETARESSKGKPEGKLEIWCTDN
ncbi:NADPH oxidase regulator NoxR [Lentinula raphanica]|uniref:NADPH oxidase regulator NoxR n=1 Tax=Lentinula raphanica TaxID=153919 RepID=A0AA38PCD6_9AGAR|nr:NADPH oxidase regulator NoxR [Lentinula raphanica]KAJ3840319.1 NADPH oxidase regulator NoxR [Lentinula raphanica]KAJ3970711.1 NADPH oxidase regulator NoxR [Lentinula raphanica]